MNKALKISIDCGQETCFSEPGKPCQYVGTRKYGSTWVCTLFPSFEKAPHTELEENDEGWLMRCDACLVAERGIRWLT